jgi:Tol biopolymer transport system component
VAATLVYETNDGSGTLHAVSLSNPDLRRELMPEVLVPGARVWSLAYSPDGAFVAHLSETEPGHTDLYLRPTRGGELQRLSAGLGTAHSPSFSPNSRWLSFVAARSATDPETVLQLVDLAQSPPRITIAGPADGTAPLWSDDGELIAVKASPNVLRSVRVLDTQRLPELPVAR